MANNYIINYFLKDLDKNEQNYLIDMLKDMPQEYIMIMREYDGSYQDLINYGYVKDKEHFDTILCTIRTKLKHYNEELDKYNINKSLRFKIDDLSASIALLVLVFILLPESKCEEYYHTIINHPNFNPNNY